MTETPFDACWDRLGRADSHRGTISTIWNDYIEGDPFDFDLTHVGDGVHILRVRQSAAIPPEFALVLGEWLYNIRACLDYIVWAASAHQTRRLPPPDQGTLQYPIYDHADAWDRNLYRLKHLADHHRDMLHRMQPFNSNPDANYLAIINRLARTDRHRRLTVTTGHIAEMGPVIQVPAGCQATLEWGERILVGGEALMARISVTPWEDGHEVWINPRSGIDLDVAEWAASPFWRPIRLPERMAMVQVFVKAEIATYEYDCTRQSRGEELLSDDYRQACDQRTHPGPIVYAARPQPEWATAEDGRPSTQDRFAGDDFPTGAAPRRGG
ncbi:MAG: hypothetical protein ACE367_14330 [Acidimicrobiales bacterium]